MTINSSLIARSERHEFLRGIEQISSLIASCLNQNKYNLARKFLTRELKGLKKRLPSCDSPEEKKAYEKVINYYESRLNQIPSVEIGSIN